MDQKLLLNVYFMAIRKPFNGQREHCMLSMGMWKKKVLRCLKQSHYEKKKKLFPTCVLFFVACPLLGGNFHRDNPNRTWTFCPLTRGIRYFYPLFRGFFIRDFTNFVRSSNFCPLFRGVRYSGFPLIRGFAVFCLWTLSLFC